MATTLRHGFSVIEGCKDAKCSGALKHVLLVWLGETYLSRLATQVLHKSFQPKGFIAHLHNTPLHQCTVSLCSTLAQAFNLCRQNPDKSLRS